MIYMNLKKPGDLRCRVATLSIRIPMDELEKAIREKEIVEENPERVYSPYTLVYEKEKTLPYIITICIILLLIIIAVIWSVKKITIDTNNSDTNSYYRIKGE